MDRENYTNIKQMSYKSKENKEAIRKNYIYMLSTKDRVINRPDFSLRETRLLILSTFMDVGDRYSTWRETR